MARYATLETPIGDGRATNYEFLRIADGDFSVVVAIAKAIAVPGTRMDLSYKAIFDQVNGVPKLVRPTNYQIDFITRKAGTYSSRIFLHMTSSLPDALAAAYEQCESEGIGTSYQYEEGITDDEKRIIEKFDLKVHQDKREMPGFYV